MEFFLGRNVNTFLHNAGNKCLSIRREVEKRRKLQVKWMEKLGRASDLDFKPGDLVRVQDTRNGVWSIKGEVEEVKDHHGEVVSKTYVVLGDSGGRYLRNGHFHKLRMSKAGQQVHVTFSVAWG